MAGQDTLPLAQELAEIRGQYYVNVDTALARARAMLPRAIRTEDPYLIGLAYETIARYYLDNGIQDSTRLLLGQSRSYYDASEIPEARAASLWSRATLASVNNRHAESLKISQQLAQACRDIADQTCLARAYWLMGGAFFYQDQLRAEQRYNARAMAILEKEPDRLYYAGLLISYAMSLHGIGRDSAARARFQEARGILERHHAPALMADLHLHEGIFYRDQDSTAFGKRLFWEGLRYADASGTRIYKALLLNNLAHLANEAGAHYRAIKLLDEEMAMAQGLDDPRYLMDFQYVVSDAYAGLHRYDSAYHYLQLADRNYRKITQDDYDNQLAELQIAYETREKEKRIQTQIEQLRQQRWLLYTAGIGFLICIAAAITLYRLSRKLRLSGQEKERLIGQKEGLIREIHHRVKNNLQIISSLLKLQSRDLDSKDSTAYRALRDSRSRVQAMGLIHEKLYLGETSNTISMQAYLQDLGNTLLDTYTLDDRVEIYYDIEAITLDIDTAIPLGLIVNELITNSLKYAFPGDRKGLVEISLYREKSDLVLRVTDDGVGEAQATVLPSGTAFGTRLLDLLSSKLNGEAKTIATVGYGTEVRFTPPAGGPTA
ncbi:two-component sensor histidine kinase [Neolewinella xylanilytica]|uniref:histidine kinase n=2 Tax=Neolewinella xylanilytica TaxID=1514080 RepID=A0A2S6I2J8_9BACT|nr:two-component sensor histidine kinase [Neolewinella xylanilytica]